MSYREVRSDSWFSRIKNAFLGVIVGIVLVLVAIGALFWNEGRSVKTARSLEEGEKSVISVSIDQLNEANNEKLIHLSGLVTTDETLTDSLFAISSDNSIKLKRKVEMYQWKEKKKKKKEKKIGGKTKTITTYDYEKVWAENLIDSSDFRQHTGHNNPSSMPYKSEVMSGREVTAGPFKLSESLINKMNIYVPLPVPSDTPEPEGFEVKVKLKNGIYFSGLNPDSPQIGDLKISFHVIKPGTYSILAMQSDGVLKGYQTGAGDIIERITPGELTADEMFSQARQENTIITWAFRAGGFLFLFFGFIAMFGPISVFADVLPFIGSLVGVGMALASFFLAIIIWSLTVSIAWILYRPLIGILLFIVALGAIGGIIFVIMNNRRSS